jgi:hypothetical protein
MKSKCQIEPGWGNAVVGIMEWWNTKILNFVI